MKENRNKLSAILNLNESDELFGSLTTHRPIASLPFASRYRILDFNLTSIAHANMRSAALFIGQSGRSVYDHIRSGKAWDLDTYRGGIFTFSQMNHKKALYEAASRRGDFYDDHKTFIDRTHSQYIFVSGSKVIANVDLLAVLDQLEASGSELIRIYAEVPRQFVEFHPDELLVEVSESGCVTGLKREGVTRIDTDTVLYDMNMTILSADLLLTMIERAEQENMNVDVDQLVEKYLFDYNVAGYDYKGYVANIDSVKAYFDASMQMLKGDYFNRLFQDKQPIITKAHNGVPTFYAKGAHVFDSMIATGCEIAGTISHSQVNRKVFVEPTAVVENSILFQGCEIAKGAHVSYAILDKNVKIGPGVVIQGTIDNPVVIDKDVVIEVN